MKENELTPFIFKDTGIAVQIRKVSPLLIMDMRQNFPEPKPPTQEVEINGKKVIEENRAHPDFRAAMETYSLEFENRMRRFLIRRGVSVHITDEIRAQIAQLKADYLEDTGSELKGSDEYIYISYIAIGTDADMEELIERITQRSQPTPEEVELGKVMFQS